MGERECINRILCVTGYRERSERERENVRERVVVFVSQVWCGLTQVKRVC